MSMRAVRTGRQSEREGDREWGRKGDSRVRAYSYHARCVAACASSGLLWFVSKNPTQFGFGKASGRPSVPPLSPSLSLFGACAGQRFVARRDEARGLPRRSQKAIRLSQSLISIILSVCACVEMCVFVCVRMCNLFALRKFKQDQTRWGKEPRHIPRRS